MSKYRIIRENGKVCIEDDFTTSLTYDDDTQLEEKIKTNPVLNYWERIEILDLLNKN